MRGHSGHISGNSVYGHIARPQPGASASIAADLWCCCSTPQAISTRDFHQREDVRYQHISIISAASLAGRRRSTSARQRLRISSDNNMKEERRRGHSTRTGGAAVRVHLLAALPMDAGM